MALYAKVLGVTQFNADGSRRQAVVETCKVGDKVVLERGPSQARGDSVVRVLTADRQHQIGYLSSNVAAEIIPDIDAGMDVEAVISDLTGWFSRSSHDVNLKISRPAP